MRTIPYRDVESMNRCSTKEEWSEWGPERVITRDDIRRFADLSHNHQWIHTDPERARSESPYGDLIAHGFLLTSLIPSLLPSDGFEISGHKVRIVRGIEKLRLLSPVYPNSAIHARTRNLIAYPAPSGKGTVVSRELEMWSHSGEKPALACTILFQYF